MSVSVFTSGNVMYKMLNLTQIQITLFYIELQNTDSYTVTQTQTNNFILHQITNKKHEDKAICQ